MPAHRIRKLAVVIFARQPVRGRVKTRLVPPLTPAEALALHVACLESTTRLAASLPRPVALRLYFTPPRATALRAARALALPRRVRIWTQRGGDLGARLRHAFIELFQQGCARVVIIGSDSPTLPRGRLAQALQALARADVTLGPARDGGYYLIGARASAADKLPVILSRIDWGTPRALRQTLARARRARARVALLAHWYDVDRPADLARLRRDLRRCAPHLLPLRRFFSRH